MPSLNLRRALLGLALGLVSPACFIPRESFEEHAEVGRVDGGRVDAGGVDAPLDAYRRSCPDEVCNAFDDDCDGRVDEASASVGTPLSRSVCQVDRASCGVAVSPARDRVYLFCDVARSWMQARAACADLGYGLVQVESEAENSQLERITASTGWSQDVWIGLNDIDSEGAWVWVDRSELGPYRPFEGDNADDRDCMSLADEPGDPLKRWRSRSCDDLGAFFCEAEARFR